MYVKIKKTNMEKVVSKQRRKETESKSEKKPSRFQGQTQ